MEEEVKVEVKTLFNRCRCCLENGELSDMWAEYIRDGGEVEVYGEMLKECFEFPWTESSGHIDQICDKCLVELRRALSFKRNILAAQEVLDQNINEQDKCEDIKLETVPTQSAEEIEIWKSEDDSNEYLDQEELEEQLSDTDDVTDAYQLSPNEYDEDNMSSDDQQEEFLSCDVEEGKLEEGGMEIEYLEDDVDAQTAVTKRKWPKKKKKSERIRIYKQYTQQDLKEALDLVVANKLSRAEAAKKYSIPVKTLSFKLRMREKEEEDADDESQDNLSRFLSEIRTILTYTNATPFKSKLGRYYCAYCSTEGPSFQCPRTLRTHARTEHAHDRLQRIDAIMRPAYLNEILKLDIENLHCTVCMTAIQDWNSMFDHLKEHSVELDLAYTRVIPYVLAEDVSCCLCGASYPHFHVLDVHMNSHYSNYICGECGDTFLTESRLKKHVETHSTQRFPCGECDKVFTLEKYRKKHILGVHLRQRVFKCHYCSETFHQDHSRHLHVVEKHSEKVKLLSCEHCPSTFTWRPYFLKHVKLTHMKPEKKFKCKLCSKCFYQKNELRNHEDWHVGKGFTCGVCDKKFSSKAYLQKHSSSHEEGARFIYIVG